MHRGKWLFCLIVFISQLVIAKESPFKPEVEASLQKNFDTAFEQILEHNQNVAALQQFANEQSKLLCESVDFLRQKNQDLLGASEESQQQFLKCQLYRTVNAMAPMTMMFTSDASRGKITLRSMFDKEVDKILMNQAKLKKQNAYNSTVAATEAKAMQTLQEMPIEAYVQANESEFLDKAKDNAERNGMSYAWQKVYKDREAEVITYLKNNVGIENFAAYFEKECGKGIRYKRKDVCVLVSDIDKKYQYEQVATKASGMDDEAYFKYFSDCKDGRSDGKHKCEYFRRQKDNQTRKEKFIAAIMESNTTAQLTEKSKACQEKGQYCDAYSQALHKKSFEEDNPNWKENYNTCQAKISELRNTDINQVRYAMRSKECVHALRVANRIVPKEMAKNLRHFKAPIE